MMSAVSNVPPVTETNVPPIAVSNVPPPKIPKITFIIIIFLISSLCTSIEKENARCVAAYFYFVRIKIDFLAVFV